MPNYLAKYIAKESEYDSYQHDVPEWFKNCGRWWGCYNKSALNIIKYNRRISMGTRDLLTESIKKYWSDIGLPEYNTRDSMITMYARDKIDIQNYIWDIILDNPEKTYN